MLIVYMIILVSIIKVIKNFVLIDKIQMCSSFNEFIKNYNYKDLNGYFHQFTKKNMHVIIYIRRLLI